MFEYPNSLIPDTLYEDQNILVIDKPAGLLSQGEHSGGHNLVDYLRHKFGRHYVGLIHRLDRNVSGLMVVAKRSKSAQRLTDSLISGRLKRQYLAVLEGSLLASPFPAAGLPTSNLESRQRVTWRDWIQKDEMKNKVTVSDRPLCGSTNPVAPLKEQKKSEEKSAVLHITPLSIFHFPRIERPCTLALIELETGRSHQIRAQCHFHGHAVLGDSKYPAQSPELLRAFPSPALHSCRLSFPHPIQNLAIKNTAIEKSDTSQECADLHFTSFQPKHWPATVLEMIRRSDTADKIQKSLNLTPKPSL